MPAIHVGHDPVGVADDRRRHGIPRWCRTAKGEPLPAPAAPRFLLQEFDIEALVEAAAIDVVGFEGRELRRVSDLHGLVIERDPHGRLVHLRQNLAVR